MKDMEPERKISKKDVVGYLNAVSKEIFKKPLDKLSPKNKQTLKLGLITCRESDDLDTETFKLITRTLVKGVK